LSDVAETWSGIAASSRNFNRDSFDAFFIDIQQMNTRTPAGEPQGNGTSDAAARASHGCAFAIETKTMRILLQRDLQGNESLPAYSSMRVSTTLGITATF
jgi:hypothetical protein